MNRATRHRRPPRRTRVKVLIMMFWVATLLLVPLGQTLLQQIVPSPAGESVVYIVSVQDEIDLGLLAFIKRSLKDAAEAKARLVVFEINTFGGRVDAAVGIRDLILDSKIPTLAFINKRAISAGALISLSCTKIFINDAGTIGAATPIQATGGEAKQVEAKVVSYFASEMRSTAEKTGRNGDIAAGMVDPNIEIKNIKKKGEPLTLTTKSAIEFKIADGLAHSVDEAIKASGVLPKDTAYRTVTPQISWAEIIARFVTSSVVSPLLITLGVLLLFFELKAPGFGVAGAGAILCFGLFFFGHMIANLAGLEEVLLFVGGLALIFTEIFVLPAHIFPGIAGIVCIVIALIMAGVPKHMPFDINMPWIGSAIQQVAISFIFSAIGVTLIFIYGPKSRLTHRLFLTHTSPSVEVSETELLKKQGTTLTDLRPAGKALIDGKKIDVVTEGGFIERGRPVEVVEIEGSRIVVKRIG